MDSRVLRDPLGGWLAHDVQQLGRLDARLRRSEAASRGRDDVPDGWLDDQISERPAREGTKHVAGEYVPYPAFDPDRGGGWEIESPFDYVARRRLADDLLEALEFVRSRSANDPNA